MLLSLLAAAIVLTPPPAPSPPSPAAVQWTAMGFTAPTPEPAIEPDSTTVVQKLIRAGGLLGGGRSGGSSTSGWSATLDRVEVAEGKGLTATPDAPQGWFTLSAEAKESAGLVLTIDLNALRAGNEKLFDAEWLQRAVRRLALDNARIVSVRGVLRPPSADHLPPMLELKAFASARSNPPGPAKPITLIAPGWSGTPAEGAAVENANWAASLRFDTGGLGAIGREGGVGTLAGLLRLSVDLTGAANAADTDAWAKTYTAWQERSGDEVRSLSTRLQQRATLACYGAASSPDLVLIIPTRRGERAETLTKAMDQLAACGGITSAKGVWTMKEAGPLTPRLAVTVCDTGEAGVFLVATVERNADRALLQQTAARLRKAK